MYYIHEQKTKDFKYLHFSTSVCFMNSYTGL